MTGERLTQIRVAKPPRKKKSTQLQEWERMFLLSIYLSPPLLRAHLNMPVNAALLATTTFELRRDLISQV